MRSRAKVTGEDAAGVHRRADQTNLLIRAEGAGDEQAIHDLLACAFPTDQEAMLVRRLRENRRLIVALVAMIEDRPIGHIAFSPVTIESEKSAATGAGLAPVAVHPDYQRRGVGARLIRAGIAACASSGIAFIAVMGEPHYYERFGFRRASLFGVDNAYGVDEPFMLLELEPDAVKAGLANYGPEFAALAT